MTHLHIVIADHREAEVNTACLTRKIQEACPQTSIHWTVAQMIGQSAEKIIAQCRSADILIVDMLKLDAATLSRLKKTQLILRHGVGVDNVDVQAAMEHGIVVGYYPGYCTDEVAEHTIAMLLALARKTVFQDDQMRKKVWDESIKSPLLRLRGRTLGIIGCGRIGKRVVELTRGFGFRTLVYDPYLSQSIARELNIELCTFHTLLKESDFISIHAPLTSETRAMIGQSELKIVKPGAYIINTARGPIVHLHALIDALDHHQLAGAALDVFADEPPFGDDLLMQTPNLILSPHIAWYSEESIHTIWDWILQDVIGFIRGKGIRCAV